jgi:hypothetical protein
VGSNPDGATSPHPGPIQPLRDFLMSVGEAVASLNTTVVGLDAVENGHVKPDSLNISWNPGDRVAAARKSRRFVLEAVLVCVAEILSEYILAISKLPRFSSVRTTWNGNTSDAEKLANIAVAAIGSENYLVVGAVLLVHWRNHVVHRRSRASLTPHQARTLKAASIEIEQSFAGLSVDRLLDDFEKKKPTLKDISSLIAMSIRLARQLDKYMDVLSEDDLNALLEYYGLRSRICQIEAQTAPAKRYDSVLRMLQSAAPSLAEAYRRLHADTSDIPGQVRPSR